MTATYDGLQFKTPLEAQWAAFFDLAGWTWHVNPLPVENWAPDFRVSFPCGHSECSGSHTLLVAVLPISGLDGLQSHPSLSHLYDPSVPADACALFGASPAITTWDMVHGSGSGIEEVSFWVPNADKLWAKAATLIS